MNEEEMKTLKEISDSKYRVPITELRLGENYKDVTRESTNQLKASMLEEIERKRDPQKKPILTDARLERDGMIIGGYHQYFAIKELIDEGKWPHGDKVWVNPELPQDDNDAKILALKDNAQYDPASTERLSEWGASLLDSNYPLTNIPLITDIKTVTLLDVMDKVSPDPTNPSPQETEPKTTMVKVQCPRCGMEFETEVTL